MKILLFILICLSFSVLVLNVQFTPWPEMLLWPYLINRGWLPYQDIAIAHSPLLIIILSVWYSVFSVNVLSLKIFTWLLIALNCLTVFWVTKKIYPSLNRYLVVLLYLVLVFRYEGNGVWFDLALVIPGLLIFYLLFEKKYFFAGLVWGIALAVKQTAFWFVVPSFIALLVTPNLLPGLIKFIKGVLLVFLFWWGALLAVGIFPSYWSWSIQFGLGVLPKMPGRPHLLQAVSSLLPFAVLVSPALQKLSSSSFILIPWIIFSSFGVFPRWELFHFQPALPFLSIFIIYLFSTSRLYTKIFVSIIGIIFILNSLRYFRVLWRQPDRFNTAADLELIRKASLSKSVFIYNWWDSIYALSGKLPPKPWVPQLEWYLSQPGVKQQLINQLGINPPEIVIYEPGGDVEIAQFIQGHYQPSHHPHLFIRK